MQQSILYISVLVNEYDVAIAFLSKNTKYGTVAVFKDIYGNL